MLNNFILIENGKEYQCNKIEEIVRLLLGDDYYNKTEDKKRETMELKATANYAIEKINHNWKDENEFILKDEITYILSLLRLNNLILLEKRDSNILTKTIDKSNIQDEYIIVNKWADSLLKDYIKE